MTENDATNHVQDDSTSTNPAETNSVDASVVAPNPTPAPIAAVTPPMPVLVCHSVTARDKAGPRRRPRGMLNGVGFSLGKGVFAFVGAPEDGTLALVEVLTGARSPLRGAIQVMGAKPHQSPTLRLRMGVLSPEPALPTARSVAEVVAIALLARGEPPAKGSEILSFLGLEHLAARNPRSLSFAENRAVELALALSTPSPLLVVLHEPLADVAINLLGLVRERIQQLGASGACVVITTSSPTDARALADEVFVLHRGVVTRDAVANVALSTGTQLLVAWVRPAEQTEGLAPIRHLARALTAHPDVSSVAWTDDPTSQASELRLSGTDIDACSLALVDAATEVGAVIEAIAPASPGLTRLRAAAEAAEALRRASMQQRPLGVPLPAPGAAR